MTDIDDMWWGLLGAGVLGHAGRCKTAELEEVPMQIVGALDVHRRQITFKTLDAGERGELARPDQPGGT